MKVSKLYNQILSDELVDLLLFTGNEDTNERADCILVLGSIKASLYRVPVAVKAYEDGLAPKILMSGGAERDFPEGYMKESLHMYQTAVQLGVPECDILVDTESRTTIENMLCSQLVLEREMGLSHIKKLRLVTTTYHMTRSLMMARTYFPDWITFIPCPADDMSTRKDNWKSTSNGPMRARNEALNLIRYVHDGAIPDFEI